MALRGRGKYYSDYSKDGRKWKPRSRTDAKSKRKSYTLVFFIALILVGAALFDCLFVSYLNDSKISKAFSNQKIIDMVEKKASEVFDNDLGELELDKEFKASVINEDVIKLDLRSLIIEGTKGFNANIYTKREKLIKEVTDYRFKATGKVGEKDKEKITNLCTKYSYDYSQIINFRFWETYTGVKNAITYYALYLELFLVAISAILLGLLYRQKGKYAHRFFRYTFEAFVSASIALVICWVFFSRYGIRISFTDFTSGEIFEIINKALFVDYCRMVINFAVFYFVIGAICFVAMHMMREDFIKQYKKTSHTKDSDQFHKELISFLEDGEYEGTGEKITLEHEDEKK